ncbi:MAG TPA: DUF2264 domain-containing protein [archaeon]|nr:DUF2264 domain-containing protein [archaeon]
MIEDSVYRHFSPGISFAILAICCAILVSSVAPGFAAAGKKEQSMEAKTVLKIPENRALSPYTGYTRDHWLEIAEKIMAGILPYFDPKTGMPKLIGVPGETGHFQHLFDVGGGREAFDRSLVLAAIYTAATGRDRIPGYKGSITEPYIKEIRRGTDPGSQHYWGKHEKYDVFGTNLALAIQLSPRFFWDPFTPEEKKNILAYFEDLVHTIAYDCNHWFFHMMAVPVLDQNGMDSNREFLTSMFERLFNWYRGDGWFIDGGNRSFDLYNLWGFQLYNNALVKFDEKWNRQFGERVRETTALFLKSYPYLFGRDGGHIPWGRSTTYRFASISAIGWAVLNGSSTIPPGQARRIASGCLKYFWERGCLSENGLLEPGYFGPNTVVAEPYIDRGAPYWAVQGMICLAVPENDPFWTEKEKPMPADEAGGRVPLPAAGMLIRVSPLDGEARLFPVGQTFSHWGNWQRGIKYCQHAYSSYLGWCAAGEGGPDLGAGRTGYSFDGKSWRYRERPRALQVDPEHLISADDLVVPDLEGADTTWYDFGEIITHTLVGNSGEVHVFWHTSGRPTYLYLGGYGISVPHGGELKKETREGCLVIHGGENHSIIKVLEAPPGNLESELLEPRPGWQHSHNFGGKGAFPHWQSSSPVKSNTPVVIYVDGIRDRMPVDPLISLHRDMGNLEITFEGQTHLVRVPY